MNTASSNAQDQHQQIQLLLPWYVNQSLEQHQQQMVDKHIRHCLVCRRELAGLRKLADAVMQKSDLDLAAETSFACLASQLQSRNAVSVSAHAARRQPTQFKLSDYLRHNTVRYAIAASLLLALLPLGLRMQSGDGVGYYTLSTAKPGSGQAMELRVVFAKSTSAADIAAALNSLHAEQQGDANSVGALTVRLDADADQSSLDHAIAVLRSRQDVLLAEPVLKP